MDRLDELEAESIYILREAYCKLGKLGMLWSIGKDSTVLLWLAQKAFFGHVPFPFIHVDTLRKIPAMIEYRDRVAKELGIKLIVHTNWDAVKLGAGPALGRLECCRLLKTEGLKQVVKQYGFDGLIVGVRRDEEGSRSKERVFSERNAQDAWDYTNQSPEFWNQFKTDFPKGHHIRVHPLLSWTELDIWQYIRREQIPVIDLYFAKDGKRYRSLGCDCCTGKIDSDADTLEKIIAELKATNVGERAGRAQDNEDSYALQKLRREGYM